MLSGEPLMNVRIVNAILLEPGLAVSRNPHNVNDGEGRDPVVPPVFKTGLAGIAFAGGFDSLPSPPLTLPSPTQVPVAARQISESFKPCALT